MNWMAPAPTGDEDAVGSLPGVSPRRRMRFAGRTLEPGPPGPVLVVGELGVNPENDVMCHDI